MNTAGHTRRSGRMYHRSGAVIPTRTRSTAHDPNTHRTQPNHGEAEGEGALTPLVAASTGQSTGSGLYRYAEKRHAWPIGGDR